MFISPVHYDNFSYFIVIPFLWEIKTCCCCCCCNYNNDNGDNDATMVIEKRSKLRLKTCWAIWYFNISTENEDFMLTLATMKCSYIRCRSKIRGHCREVPCACIKRHTSTYSHKYAYVLLVCAFVIHCSTCALSGIELYKKEMVKSADC